jgi:hypothetical protein
MTTTPETRSQTNRDQQTAGQILNLDAFWRDPRPLGQHHYAHEQARIRDELTLAFSDLGGATFALAHHRALADPRLAAHVQRIEQLYAKLGEFDETDGDHALSSAAA